MNARSVVATAALLSLWCDLAVARELTIIARPSMLPAVKEVFVKPFTIATTLPVQSESWDGGLDTLRTQAKSPENTWDLVMVDTDELATGCAEGLYEKLDWSVIGGKDHYLSQEIGRAHV